MIELKELAQGAKDLPVLERINEEAIPECERNTLEDLLATGATVTGIYREGGPVGFFVTRNHGKMAYLAYFAVRADLRSKGLGGTALRKLLEEYAGRQVVVEYEAPHSENDAEDINARRKDFYRRNGFEETGWFTFYDETEFEIGCANGPFDLAEFRRFVEDLSAMISDHLPEPYRKA